MRIAHDGILHFRVPVAVRARLAAEARASGVKLSAVARRALEAGLAPPDQPDPPPAAPAARQPPDQVAA